jgi:predicted HicB family RNase H-like nuclease
MITYKGYTAVLEVDVPSGTIVGHVIGIRDELVFRGNTAEEAVAGFHRTVDYYLARLAEEGVEPERPFSGRFNVRIDSETHRALVLDAEARRISLNDVVKRAFAAYLAPIDATVNAERPGPSRKGGPGAGTRRRKAGEGAGEPVSGKPHK